MKNKDNKGYFAFVREGGSEKFIKAMTIGQRTHAESGTVIDAQIPLTEDVIKMFEDECEEQVTSAEIMEKLLHLFNFRISKGIEKHAMMGADEEIEVDSECPNETTVMLTESKN